MPYINLQLSETQIARTTLLAKQLNISRTTYIRQAIEFFNQQTERRLLQEQFREASRQCREESLNVCREFEVADVPLEGV